MDPKSNLPFITPRPNRLFWKPKVKTYFKNGFKEKKCTESPEVAYYQVFFWCCGKVVTFVVDRYYIYSGGRIITLMVDCYYIYGGVGYYIYG